MIKAIFRSVVILLIFVAFAASYIAGCGSSSGTSTAEATSHRAVGNAAFTIAWPARSATVRLIPADSNSIVITIVSADGTGSTVTPITVKRPYDGNTPPTSSFSVDKLIVGTYTVTASAYPSETGQGVIQATGTMSASVAAGATTSVALTMSSSVDHLTVTPGNPTLTAGKQISLIGTAYNQANDVVLLSPGEIKWAVTSGSANASVDPATGVVTGGPSTGTATITATDQETVTASDPLGKMGSTTITVIPAPTPTPTPTPVPTPALPTGGVLAWERETDKDANDSTLWLYRFATQGPATMIPAPTNGGYNLLNPEFDDGTHFVAYGVVGLNYDVFEYTTATPDTLPIDLPLDTSFGKKHQDAKFDTTGRIVAYTSTNPDLTPVPEPHIQFLSLNGAALPAYYPTAPFPGRQPTFLPDGSGFAFLLDSMDKDGAITGTTVTLYAFADGSTHSIDLVAGQISYTQPTYLASWGKTKLLITAHVAGRNDDDLIALDWTTQKITDTFPTINSLNDESDPAPIDDYRFFFARTVSGKFRVFLADTRLPSVRQLDDITAPPANKQDLGLAYTPHD